ncbi:tRNA pseudouridine(38-40) synthase TruA [Butyrivibrio sp. MC2013]|uniref:tRNA pseudouridine(38-40) synthase TruA n=1 Tax=Butyrivibrio sp. MC2013 TaxID=1280686 RepID=UPI000416CD5E|nr:tRNA pseudouridine(38-40) synthase TruA [Butyrivibrio sp. MC2013]
MPRVMLTVAYDGTNYNGFAYQPSAVTIEGRINEALTDLTGCETCVSGASRTDAGVHALGNLAVFDTDSRIPPDKFAPALNSRLPSDIRIVSSCSVADDFHPRKRASVKTYEYRIRNSKTELPTDRLYTSFCSFPLDEKKMEEAGAFLVGEHNFTSFCNVESQALSHVRRIYSLSCKREGEYVTIIVRGGGFLYNMVRIIAGTLMMVGRGKIAPEDVKGILEASDRSKAGPTAPPQGLFLIGYEFPGEDVIK